MLTDTKPHFWLQFGSMGGLVVKQMLYQAKAEKKDDLVKNTIGVVCVLLPIR